MHWITKFSKFLLIAFTSFAAVTQAAEKDWQPLPLISGGDVDRNWVHIGYGKFVVDEGAIRTDPAPEGLGLLVYKKEKLGNCQIRVVFKTKELASNSGVYVRLDEGILKELNNPGAKYERDANGKPSAASSELMKASSEREDGIWYGVHHGYEVQIAAGGDPSHGTGSIYSLSPASGPVKDATGGWKTMIVTLDGPKIYVDYEGQRITSFDSRTTELPPRRIWWEPKREHKRPETGYIGLQTHDPKDIVWFKEISVRPLDKRG
ncbi:MAG TPA: DUF1080 domain-containing protein [Verrucomicrobiae bacterium]|jgi:hypothetical protein|nr:DUF1080 domain-containing protein [Verrucomicrobiae bacterium]